jgi:hypothetical protein
MSEDLFARPPADWTDDQIVVGLAEVGRRSAQLHGVALVLAGERDRRAQLYAAMDEATAPGPEQDPAGGWDDAPDR